MAAIRCREGEYSRGYVPVIGSVYDIPARLKEIIPSLFVMFNTRTQRFEVHDAAQDGMTLACELPFDELDARAVEYVRERHVSRLEQVAAEIDRYNERLEKSAYDKHMDKANYRMKEAVRYLQQHESKTELPKEMMTDDA